MVKTQELTAILLTSQQTMVRYAIRKGNGMGELGTCWDAKHSVIVSKMVLVKALKGTSSKWRIVRWDRNSGNIRNDTGVV